MIPVLTHTNDHHQFVVYLIESVLLISISHTQIKWCNKQQNLKHRKPKHRHKTIQNQMLQQDNNENVKKNKIKLDLRGIIAYLINIIEKKRHRGMISSQE